MYITHLSGFIVHLFAVFLGVMGMLCFVWPSKVNGFFDLFAANRRAHLTEQLIRLAVGFSLILYADSMDNTWLFRAFAWLIVITSLVLTVLPWQWHQQFAHYVIPYVKNHLKVYGVLSMLIAGMLLYSSRSGGLL